MRGRWLALGGAVAATALALGLVFFVVRPGTGQTSQPTQPLPTPPPDPYITDTGVRQRIHRDFSAPTLAPNDIVCEAEALVLLTPDGKVRATEKAGHKVSIQMGESVQARSIDFTRLAPDISWPVQRVNGTLVLGWRSCETP